MKRALFMLAVSFFAFSTLALADRANAQERKSYQVAQARLDLFIDSRGRRFLVDPRSGEVVGRANRNARFTRRDKAKAQKALRRYRRQSRFENRLGGLFGFRRNNGRYQKGRGGTGVRVEQP